MAKKVEDAISEIKKLLVSNKLLLGSESTMKHLRLGDVKKVYLASNCEPVVRDDVVRLCKFGQVELVDLAQSNEEIGVLCKKPYSISVIGVQA
ncbi:MAG TPA: ribosomal L7Ae/L30e/S12e/Gadd45 family protein [Candidatus Nanoarchaeia archaeon]|nr:ribosomal L7Ae/L30e/S12e/Gadd45 family protein [Candidatus Nanoarchaeia archaeon]